MRDAFSHPDRVPTGILHTACTSITCTPKVFNREELQYGAYEMGVQDYWWGDEGDEILRGDEIIE